MPTPGQDKISFGLYAKICRSYNKHLSLSSIYHNTEITVKKKDHRSQLPSKSAWTGSSTFAFSGPQFFHLLRVEELASAGPRARECTGMFALTRAHRAYNRQCAPGLVERFGFWAVHGLPFVSPQHPSVSWESVHSQAIHLDPRHAVVVHGSNASPRLVNAQPCQVVVLGPISKRSIGHHLVFASSSFMSAYPYPSTPGPVPVEVPVGGTGFCPSPSGTTPRSGSRRLLSVSATAST